MIFGGPGADRLSGGKGDDVFVLKARDARAGVEQINGGSGNDVAAFNFPRPHHVHRRTGVTYVPSRGGRFRLTRIEGCSSRDPGGVRALGDRLAVAHRRDPRAAPEAPRVKPSLQLRRNQRCDNRGRRAEDGRGRHS
jgi:hypothetical protein